MSDNRAEEKRSGSTEPSTENRQGDQPRQNANEEGYKNVETSVNNPDYFNDDYESSAEDELTKEEAKTEKEGRTGKS